MQEVENWKKFCKKKHINFQLQEAVKEALFGSYAKTDGLIPTTADFWNLVNLQKSTVHSWNSKN